MTPAFALPTELTIYTVGELRPQWLARLSDAEAGPDAAPEPADTFLVDGAAVADIDAAGVQLLLALQRTLGARQQQLQIVNASRTLGGACTALGVGSLLAAGAGSEGAA
jgi:ABC-type transporter Mla MlaB component